MEQRIITAGEFIEAVKVLVLNGQSHGLLPGTLAIALRIEADELDDQVPASQAYK